ncbi:MAG: hypothetical protein ABEJ83_00565, partial [Candidatus Nanohaloarchaea archaeon]
LVIGVFVFSIFFSGGGLFAMLKSLMFSLTSLQLQQTTTSANALGYAISCNAVDSGTSSMTLADGTEMQVPADCESKSFSASSSATGAITGLAAAATTSPVTVHCPGSGTGETCYVEGYYMPQPKPKTGGWLGEWIAGYGDPHLLIYHEKFPGSVRAAWQTTALDTVLASAAAVAALSFAMDSVAVLKYGSSIAFRDLPGAVVSRAIGKNFGKDTLGRILMKSPFGREEAEQILSREISEAAGGGVTEQEIRDTLAKYSKKGNIFTGDQAVDELTSKGVSRGRALEVLRTFRYTMSESDEYLARNVERRLVEIAEEATEGGGIKQSVKEGVRKKFQSDIEDSNKILKRLGGRAKSRLSDRLADTLPARRIRAMLDREVTVGGNTVTLREAIQKVCPSSNVCGVDADSLDSFARQHFRKVGLDPQVWKGKRALLPVTAVGVAVSAIWLDSVANDYQVCDTNSLCVDSPFIERRVVHLADEAAQYWKGTYVHSVPAAKHTRLYTASPCKADLKVKRSTTKCTAVYQGGRVWLSTFEPRVRLPNTSDSDAISARKSFIEGVYWTAGYFAMDSLGIYAAEYELYGENSEVDAVSNCAANTASREDAYNCMEHKVLEKVMRDRLGFALNGPFLSTHDVDKFTGFTDTCQFKRNFLYNAYKEKYVAEIERQYPSLTDSQLKTIGESTPACTNFLEKAASSHAWVQHSLVMTNRDTDMPEGFSYAEDVFSSRPDTQFKTVGGQSIEFSVPLADYKNTNGREQLINNKLNQMKDSVISEAWERCQNDKGPYTDCGASSEADLRAQAEVVFRKPAPINYHEGEAYVECRKPAASNRPKQIESIITMIGTYDGSNFESKPGQSGYRDKYSGVSPNFCYESQLNWEDIAQGGVAVLDIGLSIASQYYFGPLGNAVAGSVIGGAAVFAQHQINQEDKWPS